MRAIVIGGATSGAGKTTITTGIMGALARRGYKVQPFKAGPDYIDPSYHTWITGNPSRNLDTWMLPQAAVNELFQRAMKEKDIGIIEGVMGLYDGHAATTDEGSTAELAKLLHVPVILAVDGSNSARSTAAVVRGYRDFDRDLNFGGVILNGMGSESHYQICREAIEHYTGARVLGYLPRRDILTIPERHLGLIPTIEGPAGQEFQEALISQCEATLDLDTIIRLSGGAAPPAAPPALFPAAPQPPVVRIAVARDKAFSFYYQDSLDLLAAWGAELAFFSPLSDTRLPENSHGLYIGGGFPEMYAGELAVNEPLKAEVKAAAVSGMPVYGECGGLMYLGESIRDFASRVNTMTGILPLSSRIDNTRLTLGYRTVQALADGPLLQEGQTVRAHEFHWSTLEKSGGAAPAYRVLEKSGGEEGFQQGNILASYIHLHLGALPTLAPRFVEMCHRFQRDKGKSSGGHRK